MKHFWLSRQDVEHRRIFKQWFFSLLFFHTLCHGVIGQYLDLGYNCFLFYV
jgi:hypothetical protein